MGLYRVQRLGSKLFKGGHIGDYIGARVRE